MDSRKDGDGRATHQPLSCLPVLPQLPLGSRDGCSPRRPLPWQGPRTLLLHKSPEDGFGFTLRHFIVYPPDSAVHCRLKVWALPAPQLPSLLPKTRGRGTWSWWKCLPCGVMYIIPLSSLGLVFS